MAEQGIKTKKKITRNVEIPWKPGFPTVAWNQENISSAEYWTYVLFFQ